MPWKRGRPLWVETREGGRKEAQATSDYYFFFSLISFLNVSDTLHPRPNVWTKKMEGSHLSFDCLRFIMIKSCDSRTSVRLSLTCTKLYGVFSWNERALRICGYEPCQVQKWLAQTNTKVKEARWRHENTICDRKRHAICYGKPCVEIFNPVTFLGLCPNCSLYHPNEKCPLGKRNFRCRICRKTGFREHIKRFCCPPRY